MNGTLVSSNSEVTSILDSSTHSSVNEELFSDVSQTDNSCEPVVPTPSRPNTSDHNFSVARNIVCESVLNLHSVPEVSYSSSDDDEFFYDAPEESSPVSLMPKTNKSEGQVIDNFDEMSFKDQKSISNNTIDYDLMYESEEEELGSIENHGSVISHLISQVKIGMDLTKVVLPTFILERRSLLEMYADFFAHPDLFVRYVLFLLFITIDITIIRQYY